MLNPYRGRGFYDPLSEMNRLFDDMFGGPARRAAAQQGTAAAAWAPAIDVLQNGGDLVVRAELPGAKPEDVDITVQNGVLAISGRVQEERQQERGGYLVRERRSGSLRRSLQLPQGVDESAINARFENGVLEVTIQGAAAVQEPKRIQIEGGESSGEGSSGGEQGSGGQQSTGG